MGRNKKIIIGLCTLLIIIGALAGLFYVRKNYNKKEIAFDNTNNKIVEKENTNIEKNNTINSTKQDVVVEKVASSSKKKKKELFQDYYKKAEKLMKKMTLEEKVSQMFMVRYPGKGAVTEIKKYRPGGYVLFAQDFKNETKKSMKKKLANCQKASKIPLVLSVDEEGGTVVRVSKYRAFRKSKFESPQYLYKKGGMNLILKDSTEKSKLLKSVGINMNLAPVADAPTKSKSFIYKRTFGKSASKTATYISKVVKNMKKDKMVSCLKHFPGYGDNVDTHTGIAIDKRSYSKFKKYDFLPFKAGIQAGAPTVLVSHNIVKCMDKNKPASLSKNVHKILREDLKFSGIIITDDLAMKAVKKYVDNGQAAVQAVLAGNDMIISSDFKNQRNEVIRAVKKGKIKKKTIDTAVKRILAWKYAYKIIK